MTTTHIPTDEIVTMIDDVLADLDITIEAEPALLAWINDERNARAVEPRKHMPVEMPAAHASQAIADIIAKRINQADEELVDAAMQDMGTDEGWRFEPWNLTLWVECSDDHDTIVVWLGNEIDYDMARIGRAKIAN